MLLAQLSHDLDLSESLDHAMVTLGEVINLFYGNYFRGCKTFGFEYFGESALSYLIENVVFWEELIIIGL